MKPLYIEIGLMVPVFLPSIFRWKKYGLPPPWLLGPWFIGTSLVTIFFWVMAQ